MNQTDRTVETTTPRTGAKAAPWLTPRADIQETKDSYLLELEMPGVQKDGVEIAVDNNELTIIGRRSDVQPAGEVVYRESRPIDYRRAFDLDPSIDTGKITARMDQGVVKLTLPKAESVKPRKIAVTG